MIPLRRRAWGTQKPPLGARIDAGHPLVPRYALTFPEGGGQTVREHVTGGTGTGTNTPTWTVTRDGLSAGFSTTSLYHFGNAGLALGLGNASIYFRGVVGAASTYRNIARIEGAGSAQYYWGLQNNDRIRFVLLGLVEILSGITATAGHLVAVGITYTRSVSARFHVCDLDTGALSSETVDNATTPGTDGGSGECNIGGYDGGLGLNWNSPLSCMYLWDRALLDPAYDQLDREPYAFFVPPGPRVRYFFAAAGAAAHTLNADPGTYTLTGSAATLAPARRLTADPGTYTATGSAAALSRTRALMAEPGTYALTGASAALLAARLLSADPATYALTGSAASLARGAKVAADPGAYALTGGDATLEAARLLSADPGSYAVSGAAATLTKTSNASLIWLRVRR